MLTLVIAALHIKQGLVQTQQRAAQRYQLFASAVVIAFAMQHVGRSRGHLLMVTLFTDGQCDGKAVSRWGKWAGGIRRICARRILQVVEVENKFSFTVHA